MVNSLANALVQAIHNEYQFSIKQIEAVLKLLEDKNTVPFIARYRKEMTDGLDEVEIKKLQMNLTICKTFKNVKMKLYIVLSNKAY